MKPMELRQQEVGQRIHAVAIERARQASERVRANRAEEVRIEGRHLLRIQSPDIIGRDQLGFCSTGDPGDKAEIGVDET